MSMCITSYFIISSGSNLCKESDPFWVDDDELQHQRVNPPTQDVFVFQWFVFARIIWKPHDGQ